MTDQHHQLAVVHMHAVLDPGTARGRPHAWIDRQSALSSSPQDLCLLLADFSCNHACSKLAKHSRLLILHFFH
jgi:hypothetical protein